MMSWIRLGYFDGIVASLARILTKQHGARGGKYLLKTLETPFPRL